MRISLALATLLLSHAVYSASEEPLIVITSTGIATPLEHSPGTTLVITGEEMQKRGDTRVTDALQRLPGITLATNGPAGQTTSLFARGTNSNHTLVMLDGMVINDPSSPAGAFDFSTIGTDNLERIEVVYGPVSTLYGSSATGAVINLISKAPTAETTRNLNLAVGTNAQLEAGLSLSGSHHRFSYLLSLAHQQSDGETSVVQREAYLNTGQAKEDDGYRNSRVMTRLGWQISETTAINLLAFDRQAMNEIDEWLIEDRDWSVDSSETGIQVSLDHRPLNAPWNASATLRYFSTQRDSYNPRQLPTENFIDNSFNGERKEIETRLNLFALDAHTISLIGNLTKSSMRSSGVSRYGSEYGDYVISESSHADTSNLSFAMQDQWQGENGLSVTGSVRTDNHEAFGQHNTWRLALNQAFADERGRLLLAAGTGFRAPTLNELYGFSPTNYATAYRGNPDLQPEESETIETGVDYHFSAIPVTAGIRLYNTRFSNLIQTVYDNDFNSTSENINHARMQGAELTIGWQPDDSFSVDFNYSYTDAIDTNSGDALLRRPQHQANLNIDYAQSERLSHWMQIHYTGAQFDISPVTYTSTELDAYTLINIGSQYRWSDTVSLYGKITNLANTSYEPLAGYRCNGIGGLIGINASF